MQLSPYEAEHSRRRQAKPEHDVRDIPVKARSGGQGNRSEGKPITKEITARESTETSRRSSFPLKIRNKVTQVATPKMQLARKTARQPQAEG